MVATGLFERNENMGANSGRRLICLVSPIGCDETTLMKARGSLPIIAAEQYILIRKHVKEYDIALYSNAIEVRENDILIIMTCLNLVPESIITAFKKVVYFFDDLNPWKIKEDRYASRFKYVSAIFHPVASVALNLSKTSGVPSFHLPWSLARIPDPLPSKSAIPSFFVDMDDRLPYIVSLARAAAFIEALEETPATVYVLEKYVDRLPAGLRDKITPTPFLPHEDFLKFLGGIWYYVSGIPGSFEFAALEASFMGCGLVSLNSALNRAHMGGTLFFGMEFPSEHATSLIKPIEMFDAVVAAREAHLRYPHDYAIRIPYLLELVFPGAAKSGAS